MHLRCVADYLNSSSHHRSKMWTWATTSTASLWASRAQYMVTNAPEDGGSYLTDVLNM